MTFSHSEVYCIKNSQKKLCEFINNLDNEIITKTLARNFPRSLRELFLRMNFENRKSKKFNE